MHFSVRLVFATETMIKVHIQHEDGTLNWKNKAPANQKSKRFRRMMEFLGG
jgi:hypothetical protein